MFQQLVFKMVTEIFIVDYEVDNLLWSISFFFFGIVFPLKVDFNCRDLGYVPLILQFFFSSQTN